MKPLALLLLLPLLALASSSRAASSTAREQPREVLGDQRRTDVAAGRTYDGSPSDALQELKKKYAKGGQKEAAGEANDAKAAEGGAKAGGGFKLRPALYARYAKGPDGYSLKQLVENLNWTEKNLGGLIDYIHPWEKGVEAPAGEDLASAQRDLVSESAAAAALIADADAAFAKGIPRDPRDPPDRLRAIILFATRPTFAYKNPTPEQRVQEIAGAQSNVLGHSAALIEYKRLNPPDAKYELSTEGWLAEARAQLAAAQARARQ